MESLGVQARHATFALGKRGKTSRGPSTVREIVLDYVREQRALPGSSLGKAIREATRRAIEAPGTVTIPRDLTE